MKRQTTKTITPGMIKPMTTRRPVETFSLTLGYEMSGLVMSKGRLFGVMAENAAPTAAMALSKSSVCCPKRTREIGALTL